MRMMRIMGVLLACTAGISGAWANTDGGDDQSQIVIEPVGDPAPVGSWGINFHAWGVNGIAQIQVKIDGIKWDVPHGITPYFTTTSVPKYPTYVVADQFYFNDVVAKSGGGTTTVGTESLPSWKETLRTDDIVVASGSAISVHNAAYPNAVADLWYALWFGDAKPETAPFTIDIQMYDASGVRKANQAFLWHNSPADPSYYHFTSVPATWQMSMPIPEPLTMLGVFAGVGSLTTYLRRRHAA